MPDPVARLRFDGDPNKLVKATDKVGDAMSKTVKGIERDADKAEQALKGIESAAKGIKPVDVRVTAKTDEYLKKLESIEGISPEVKVKLATQAAEADIRALDKKLTNQLRGVEVPVKADTSRAESQIRGMGKDAGAAAGRDAGESFGSKFTAGLAAIPVAGVLAGIATDAIGQAMSSARVTASLQNQMGISPADAKNYGQRVGDAYASGLGDSQAQIAEVYSTLSSDVQDWSSKTQSAQDAVARKMTKVVQGFGIDVPEAIQATSAMVANKLVPDWDTAMDVLVTGYQTLGSRADDFTDTLQEYSPYFKNLGIDAGTALGIIQQGLKAGARDTDFIADAFKEFNLLVVDGSKKTTDALAKMGPEFKKVPDQIRQGGDVAMAATDKVIDKLRSIKDVALRDEIGLALFGTKWEDTMKQIVNSVDVNMAKANTSYAGAVDKMTVATETEMDKFQRRWERGLSKVGEGLAGFANDVAGFADDVGNKIRSIWEDEPEGAPILSQMGGIIDDLRAKVGDPVRVKVDAEWQKVQDIHNRLQALPPNTPVTVTGLTETAMNNLRVLGYTVNTLPNGQVTVTANTNPAKDAARAAVNDINNMRAVVKVVSSFLGIPQHREGGWVGGKGSGTSDSNIIAASRGEFITKERVAQQPENAEVLEDMNSGRDWKAKLMASNGGVPRMGYGPAPAMGPNVVALKFTGNTDTALANLIQNMVRSGEIQVVAA